MYTIFLVTLWTYDHKFMGYLHPPYSSKQEADERVADYKDGNPGLVTVEEYKHARA